ncbi:MAG: hypothetical protein QNJ38_01785 [Prochloraceae cyanobacterium]|nr:hypothetical protein [Prochloraceae cyanobacterium]
MGKYRSTLDIPAVIYSPTEKNISQAFRSEDFLLGDRLSQNSLLKRPLRKSIYSRYFLQK